MDYLDIGYKTIEDKEIPEIGSRAILLEHIKTGARVLKLKNDDDNNVFGIGFKTPPNDSTGVAHIVEHCVLSGSRKYKTKEPFMDVYKGSLQTFLNAMTFGDKTIYPIGSRNDKDFENLMDIYLDAVFYPAIDSKPEIFMQEGWHYDIKDKDDPIEYKGVVYNEMKGAMSTPEDQVYEFIDQANFPDTIYSHNSGGDPYAITDLSYESFVDFHKKHYHPSNSYIFFYGDRDLEKDLEYLDKEYLSSFEKEELNIEIPYQEAFEKKRYENYEYSTSDELEGLDRDYLAYSIVTGDILDGKTDLMTSILLEALVDSGAGPIKKALLDAKIGEDVFGMTSSIRQIPFTIICKNTSSTRINEFEGIIETCLENLVANGIDKKLLLSTLNKFEYSLREATGFHTRGIIDFIRSFDTWLYGDSPIKALEFSKNLEELREGIDEGIFEKFIEERILNNNHKTIISVLPNLNLNERRDEEVREKLKDYKESLSDESIEALIDLNEKLEHMQLTEDSPEAKATIPSLDLEDVDAKLREIPREKLDSSIDNIYHDIFTGGINYLNYVFDISHINVDELGYAALLTELLGSMDTNRRNYIDLINEVYMNTGGINFSINAFNDANSDAFYPKLIVSTKYLDGGAAEADAIALEIITGTKLDSIKRYKDLVKEIKSRYEMNLYQNGSAIVMSRARSHVDKSAKYGEYISGLDFFYFIQDLENKLEEEAADQLVKLKEVYEKLFTGNNLILNITGSRDEAKEVLSLAEDGLNKLRKVSYEKADLVFKYIAKNEGIKSSSNVQFVSKAAKLSEIDGVYNGKMAVLSQVLSKGYLHNHIRAKGGAYGAGISIGKRTLATYSYRDPNLEETIKVYDNMGDYLRNIDLDENDLKNYIIGTVSGFNPPYTPRSMGFEDLSRYITGRKLEELEKLLEEALSTNLDDLREYGDFLDKAMEENHLVVLGNKEKINMNEDLFETTYNVMK